MTFYMSCPNHDENNEYLYLLYDGMHGWVDVQCVILEVIETTFPVMRFSDEFLFHHRDDIYDDTEQEFARTNQEIIDELEYILNYEWECPYIKECHAYFHKKYIDKIKELIKA